jgi:hypothetical protein
MQMREKTSNRGNIKDKKTHFAVMVLKDSSALQSNYNVQIGDKIVQANKP